MAAGTAAVAIAPATGIGSGRASMHATAAASVPMIPGVALRQSLQQVADATGPEFALLWALLRQQLAPLPSQQLASADEPPRDIAASGATEESEKNRARHAARRLRNISDVCFAARILVEAEYSTLVRKTG